MIFSELFKFAKHFFNKINNNSYYENKKEIEKIEDFNNYLKNLKEANNFKSTAKLWYTQHGFEIILVLRFDLKTEDRVIPKLNFQDPFLSSDSISYYDIKGKNVGKIVELNSNHEYNENEIVYILKEAENELVNLIQTDKKYQIEDIDYAKKV